MCIATFVLDEERFIMTFSRDENPLRSSLAPQWLTASNGRIFCPRDEQAGGTWIGYNKKILACLQNGAWIKHERKTAYKRSRGHVLMDILDRDEPETILNAEALDGIEPFTLSIFDCQTKDLKVYRFDENELTCHLHDLQEPLVIASCTLYDNAACEYIAGDFLNSRFLPEEVFQFHDEYRIGKGKNHFTNKVSTVSITQFVLKGDTAECRFMDIIKGENMSMIP